MSGHCTAVSIFRDLGRQRVGPKKGVLDLDLISAVVVLPNRPAQTEPTSAGRTDLLRPRNQPQQVIANDI